MTDALQRPAGLPGWDTLQRVGRYGREASAVERATDVRRSAEARRPHHVGVLLGLSAGAYAVALAGVTGLQSATDQATIAARQPAMATVEAAAAEHDRLEAELADTRAALAGAGRDYDAQAARVADLQARLETLASAVGSLEGATLALPTRLSLPSAPRVPAAVSRPATQASTGASGG